MNRAHYIHEIFEPSNERPVPPYTHTIGRTSPLGSQVHRFHYDMHLPDTSYRVIMNYYEQDRSLTLLFTARHGPTSDPEPPAYRSSEEIQQGKRNLIHVIRAMSQVVMQIHREYPIRVITFTANAPTPWEVGIRSSVRPRLVEFCDHLASRLATEYNGQLVMHAGPNNDSKIYRIILPGGDTPLPASPRPLSRPISPFPLSSWRGRGRGQRGGH